MKLILFAAVVLSAFAAPADGYRPEQWNLDARRNFAAQRFGVFIHWGLYANYAQKPNGDSPSVRLLKAKE